MFRRLSHKKILWLALAIVLIVLAVSLIFNENEIQAPEPAQSTSCLNINDKCIELEKADTNQDRIKGLSGRPSLTPGAGMLFVFDQAEEQCMWMKDMHFSIDMVWLDESKVIQKIEQNVSPETYPQSFCQADSLYVIEFNAGDAEKLGLQVGQKLSF